MDLKKIIRPLGIQDIVMLVAIVSLTCVQLSRVTSDPGFGWHLATGDWIINNLKLPTEDPFLSISRPWIVEQWLAEVIMSASFRLGGWSALYLLTIIVYLFSFTVLLYHFASHIVKDLLAVSLSCFLAFKLGQVHFLSRPVMFSFPCFIVVCSQIFILLRAIKTGQSDGIKKAFNKAYLYIPITLAVWVNLHPSFMLGLAVCVLLPLALVLDRIILHAKIVIPYKYITILLILAFCATLLNPYGFKLHYLAFSVNNSEFIKSLFNEWHSPNFREYSGVLFEISIMALLGSLFISRCKGLQWGFFEFLLLTGLGYATINSVRMLPYFGIALVIPLAEAFSSAVTQLLEGKLKIIAVALKNISRKEALTLRGKGIFYAFLIISVLYASFYQKVLFYNGEFGPEQEKYPYKALDLIKVRERDSARTVVAAIMNWGGFITWYGEGRIKAIIDDRSALLGETFIKRYLKEIEGGKNWRDLLKEFEAKYLLLEPESTFAKELKSDAPESVLYEDDHSILFYGL
ncbi:MAG: hypothetical protein ACOX2O_00620 [Bdellovibrionota bacterium]